MRETTDLEMVAIYEAHAAKWFAHALTLDKDNPAAAFHVRDYAQHCSTMAEIFRLRHSDSVAENTKCDDSFFAPCWRGYREGLSDTRGPDLKPVDTKMKRG
jgi:hypothetical protein